MPLENIPSEIRDVYERINHDLKDTVKDDSKRAKITWTIIKRKYKKDKEGKWVEKSNGALEKIVAEILFLNNDFDLAFASMKNKDSHKINISAVASIMELEEDKVNVFKNKDIMPITMKMLHINKKNDNGDIFLYEDVADALDTIKNKPIDKNHDIQCNIGVLNSGEIIKGDSNSITDPYDYLKVDGTIWKSRYAKEADEMKERYEKGELFCSMESFFCMAGCPVCNSLYAEPDEYCEHLKNRTVERQLRFINFAGLGVMLEGVIPADKNAEIISLGNDSLASLEKDIDRLIDITNKLKNKN